MLKLCCILGLIGLACGVVVADDCGDWSASPQLAGWIHWDTSQIHYGETALFWETDNIDPNADASAPQDYDEYKGDPVADNTYFDWLLEDFNGGGAQYPCATLGAVYQWTPRGFDGPYWRLRCTVSDQRQPGDCRNDFPSGGLPRPLYIEGATGDLTTWQQQNGRWDGDPVNLANGGEVYASPHDLVAYNATGSDVVYQRTYHSRLASLGYSSAGLSSGWVDNYDVRVERIRSSVRSNSNSFIVGLKMIYPNRTSDIIGVGSRLSAPVGAPFTVSGDINAALTVTWKNLTTWVFDYDENSDTYPLSHITNRAGRTIDIVRNLTADPHVSNRIESILAAGGAELMHFEYGGQTGYPLALSRITDMSEQIPANRRYVAYTYDSSGLTGVSQIKSSSPRWTYEYDPTGGLLTHTSEPAPTSTNSVDTYIEYDGAGRVHATHDGKGNTRTYDYEASYTPPGCATTFAGTRVDVGKDSQTVRSWIQLFDPKTKFATGTYDSGRQTKIEYGTHDYDWMYPVGVTDKNGRVVTYTWDPQGHGTLASVTVPSTTRLGAPTSTVTSFTRLYAGGFPNLTEVEINTGDINAGGEHKSPTRLFFNDSGNLFGVFRPIPGSVHATGFSITSLTYADGYLETIIPPVNAGPNTPTVTFGYSKDANGKVTSKRPNFVSVRTVAAGNGQPIVVSLQWNTDGTLRSVLDAQGAEVDYTHYADGAIQDVVSKWANGADVAKTTFAYDHLGGRLTDTLTYGFPNGVQSLLTQVHHDYDDAGAYAGGSGDTEPYALDRDPLGRVTSLTDGNDHSTGFGYVSGLLTPETDAITTASAAFPGAPGSSPPFDTAATANYHAIQNGDPSAPLDRNIDATDGNGVKRTYVYAGRNGELTNVLYTDTINPSHDISANNLHYTYDLYARVLSVRHGASDSVYQDKAVYAYDDLGNVTSVSTTYAGLTAKTLQYTYHPDGSRKHLTAPGLGLDYTYNLAGQLTGITDTYTSATYSWSYKNNGLLSGATNPVNRTTYTYNSPGFLTSQQTMGSTNAVVQFQGSFTYDGMGNRLTETRSHNIAIPPPPMMPAFVDPNSPNGTTTFQYHPDNLTHPYGSLYKETSTRFGGFTNVNNYDAALNPTTFRGGATTFNWDNQDAAFTYDGNGNPTTYCNHAGAPVALTFDAENRMTSFGTTLTCAYNGAGLRVKKTNATGQVTWFLYDGTQPIIEMNGSGTVTATSMYGPTGLFARRANTVWVYHTFDPSGNLVSINSDPWSGPIAGFDAFGNPSNPTIATPFKYQGAWGSYTDSETGLVLQGHRYYDPATGRWLTRDPIGYAGGINLYAYCGNNPINYADPLGLCGEDLDTQGTDDGQLNRDYTDGTLDWMRRVRHVAPTLNEAIGGMNGALDAVGGLGVGALKNSGGGGRGGGSGVGSQGEAGGQPPELVDAAQQRYPKLANINQDHHETPIYLGGAKHGNTVELDGAYHQMITNAFRRQHGYGREIPDPATVQAIEDIVYGEYPIPGR